MGRERASVEDDIAGRLDRGQLGEAATAALECYGPEILGYLVAILRDETAASDVFGDFCENLWRGLAGFRRLSSFRTWAYRLAWNAAQRFWRDPFRRRVRRLTTSEYARVADRLIASSLPSSQPPADRLAAMRETLAPEEQTLLILRVDKGLAWKEIAQVLADSDGVPHDVAGLRKRFERLKDRLMALAAKQGLIERSRRAR